MTQDELKTLVGQAALAYVVPGEIVGVGTGSTVNKFIDALATIRHTIRGAVSSSLASTERLQALGITVFDSNEVESLAVYIDGADEIDDQGYMVKGGGAALTREKIVAAQSQRFVCIADESKRVPVLGAFPLPVEVIPMAVQRVTRQFAALGGQASLRLKDGQPLVWVLLGLSLDQIMESHTSESEPKGEAGSISDNTNQQDWGGWTASAIVDTFKSRGISRVIQDLQPYESSVQWVENCRPEQRLHQDWYKQVVLRIRKRLIQAVLQQNARDTEPLPGESDTEEMDRGAAAWSSLRSSSRSLSVLVQQQTTELEDLRTQLSDAKRTLSKQGTPWVAFQEGGRALVSHLVRRRTFRATTGCVEAPCREHADATRRHAQRVHHKDERPGGAGRGTEGNSRINPIASEARARCA